MDEGKGNVIGLLFLFLDFLFIRCQKGGCLLSGQNFADPSPFVRLQTAEMNVVLTIDHPNRHFESFKLLRWHFQQNVVSGVNWHFWFSMKGNLISRPLPLNVDGGRDKKGEKNPLNLVWELVLSHLVGVYPQNMKVFLKILIILNLPPQ